MHEWVKDAYKEEGTKVNFSRFSLSELLRFLLPKICEDGRFIKAYKRKIFGIWKNYFYKTSSLRECATVQEKNLSSIFLAMTFYTKEMSTVKKPGMSLPQGKEWRFSENLALLQAIRYNIFT